MLKVYLKTLTRKTTTTHKLDGLFIRNSKTAAISALKSEIQETP